MFYNFGELGQNWPFLLDFDGAEDGLTPEFIPASNAN
jgi:hypothetical protein